MFLNGQINLKGPQFQKDFITFKSEVSAEFYLDIKKGILPVIDHFNIGVELDQDKEITISTNIEEDDTFSNSLFISIENKEGDGIGFILSIEQVNALSQILERFKEGFYAIKTLAAERVVKSA